MEYNENELESIGERIRSELGFSSISFDKKVSDELYFNVWDGEGIKDRVRFKPNAGLLYTYYQGQWKQVYGFKFD
ncbi:hypothetical protein NSQ20_11875 [Paenibacillus sp. FSL K6-1122]|uniref:hypothetical protein n=1 Tax=Paenibacillus sp. FSL K6-1122 TaxID=2954512 RepID=UPI0030ED5714